MSKNWYIIQTFTGYEQKIERTIRALLDKGDLDPAIVTDVKVPIEEIVEVKDGKAWFLRSNRSYREFVKRFFNVTITKKSTLVEDINFTHLVNGCLKDGTSAFYKETMPDGTVIHSFARRINENPITGRIALAVMVLTVKNE